MNSYSDHVSTEALLEACNKFIEAVNKDTDNAKEKPLLHMNIFLIHILTALGQINDNLRRLADDFDNLDMGAAFEQFMAEMRTQH